MSDAEQRESGPRPPPEGQDRGAPGWERELLNRLAFAALIEQRRARRWGIFFKCAVLVYLVVLLVAYLPRGWLWSHAGRHVALVDVRGVIADDSDASAERVIAGLRAAFKDPDTAGVIVRINSPGGSPVQAGYIHDEMVRLRKKHPKIPLYAVITDIGASGGYYVAVGADKIYADRSSIVGSIGVLMNGFGFVGTLDKLGVERRLITAGKHKGFLDPFSPEKPEEVAHLKSILDQVHRQFIHAVEEGRGDRLHDDPDLFSGYFWSGEKSVQLGLVDGLGSSGYVARELIGVDRIVNFTPHRTYLERLAERMGASAAGTLSAALGLTSLRLQ